MDDADRWGRLVREAWVAACRQHKPQSPAHYFYAYDDRRFPEVERVIDRAIGEAVAAAALAEGRARLAQQQQLLQLLASQVAKHHPPTWTLGRPLPGAPDDPTACWLTCTHCGSTHRHGDRERHGDFCPRALVAQLPPLDADARQLHAHARAWARVEPLLTSAEALARLWHQAASVGAALAPETLHALAEPIYDATIALMGEPATLLDVLAEEPGT